MMKSLHHLILMLMHTTIQIKKKMTSGELMTLEHSSSEFIEKASGIKTRHVIDKKNILDIDRMMPSLKNEDELGSLFKQMLELRRQK